MIYYIQNLDKERIVKKLNKKLQKERMKNRKIEVILAKNLKKFKQKIKNVKIIEGEEIFYELIESILKKILKKEIL